MPLIPSIRNWRSSPPAGGWNLSYHPPERPEIVVEAVGHNYTDVLAVIQKWRLNNGLPANDTEVFSWANAEWCRRDPGRCLAPADSEPTLQVAGTGRRTLTPADYGKALWTNLNTFPVCFDQALWLGAIEHIKQLLNPKNPRNNGAGCPNCHLHFAEFNAKYPPHRVVNEDQAAVWCWSAHDAANVAAGKPHRPSFRTCATIFGWRPLSLDRFNQILTTLQT